MRRPDFFRATLLVALLAVLVSVACGRDSNGFDLSGSLVPADQIHLGGPPRDGIPSIDRPRFVAATDADFLSDSDRVLGLARNGRDPYAAYAGSSEVYFPLSASSRRYHPKERVLGLEVDGRFKAYPFAELSQSGEEEVSDSFAGRALTIRFDPIAQSARAFDEKGVEVTAVTGFWFAWYAFHPETEVYTASNQKQLGSTPYPP